MVVGKNTLKAYEFKTLEDYFGYIIDSKINGNYSQMRELYNKLDTEQKKEFVRYLRHNEINNIQYEDLI